MACWSAFSTAETHGECLSLHYDIGAKIDLLNAANQTEVFDVDAINLDMSTFQLEVTMV